MWLNKTVAAIIPASRNKKTIFSVIQALDATSFIDEVIVVDNAMDHGTYKEVKRTRAGIVEMENYGDGKAIKTGFKSTKADILIVIDPSGIFVESDVVKLLSYSTDFDIVFGSRTHLPLIGGGSGMTFIRRLINDLFGKLISVLYMSSNLTDVRCMLRLTSQKGWKAVQKMCDSDSELLLAQWQIAAAKKKVRFVEIPINFKRPKSGSPDDNMYYLAQRGLQTLYYIIKMRFS